MDVEELDFEEKRNYVRHARLAIIFNHETGPEYAAASFALLRSKYLPRVESFLAEAAVDETKVFVLHLYQMTQHEIAHVQKVAKALDARFPLGCNYVVCLVTPHAGNPIAAIPEELADPREFGFRWRVSPSRNTCGTRITPPSKEWLSSAS